MNPSHLTSRWLMLFVVCALLLPSPALALRPQEKTEGTGLEELANTLRSSNPVETVVGLEEKSPLLTPEFVKYEKASVSQLERGRRFRVKLYEDGSVKEVTVGAHKSKKPPLNFSFGEGLAFLIASDAASALVIQDDGTLFQFSSEASYAVLRPDPPTVEAFSEWEGEVRSLLNSIGKAGGVKRFAFVSDARQGLPLPSTKGAVRLNLADGREVIIQVEPENFEIHYSGSGLEEGKGISRRKFLAGVAAGVVAGVGGTKVVEKLTETPVAPSVRSPVTTQTTLGAFEVTLGKGLLRVQLPAGYARAGIRGYLLLPKEPAGDARRMWYRHALREWQKPNEPALEKGVPADGLIEFQAQPGKEASPFWNWEAADDVILVITPTPQLANQLDRVKSTNEIEELLPLVPGIRLMLRIHKDGTASVVSPKPGSGLEEVKEVIRARKVIAVIPVPNVADALASARAAVQHGFIPEIAFRGETNHVKKVIGLLSRELDQTGIPVLAGTVVTPDQVQSAYVFGARGIVSPCVIPEVIQRTKQLLLLSFPGVGDLEEARQARVLGADGLKVFPTAYGDPDGKVYIELIKGVLGPKLAAEFDKRVIIMRPDELSGVDFPPATYGQIDSYLQWTDRPPIQTFRLPSVRGPDLIRLIHQEFPDAPIIPTGYTDPNDVATTLGLPGVVATGMLVAGDEASVENHLAGMARSLQAFLQSESGLEEETLDQIVKKPTAEERLKALLGRSGSYQIVSTSIWKQLPRIARIGEIAVVLELARLDAQVQEGGSPRIFLMRADEKVSDVVLRANLTQEAIELHGIVFDGSPEEFEALRQDISLRHGTSNVRHRVDGSAQADSVHQSLLRNFYTESERTDSVDAQRRLEEDLKLLAQKNLPSLSTGLEEGTGARVVERFVGLFRNGDPAQLVTDPDLAGRLNLEAGNRVTLVVDVDPTQAPTLSRIFHQEGVEIPLVWRQVPQVRLSDNLTQAEATLLAEQAGGADLALVDETSVRGVADQWDRLFRDHGLPAIQASPAALQALEKLQPAELAAFLSAVRSTGGLLTILGIEIEERTPGERRLFIYA